MTRKLLVLAAAALLVGLFASLGSSVQAANQSRALITQPIDNSHLITLYGNTRPEASARHDRGRVADEFQLNHMLLQLKRAPEAETAFAAYIDSLSDKTSPNFRHWMSAAEQGEKYGVSQQDIDAITGWLRSEGFTVGHVYPNHMVIDFSRNRPDRFATSFHTEITPISKSAESSTSLTCRRSPDSSRAGAPRCMA